jgi:hypothetical protein
MALKILVEKRKKESKELYEKAKEIAKKRQNKVLNDVEEPQIVMLPPRREDPTWIKEWQSFKIQVELIMPIQKLIHWRQHHGERCIDLAMAQNAKMRIITEQGAKEILANPSPDTVTASYAKKLNYIDYKFATGSPVELAIF